jgi:hypothetical protein
MSIAKLQRILQDPTADEAWVAMDLKPYKN